MSSPETEIFFATSFSGHVDYETGEVNPDFKQRIEGVLTALRDVGGFAVYCSMEAENWKISQQEPGVSMASNFANIQARPIFLALVDKVGSDGRGLEVEHAYRDSKRVFLATGPGEELSWVMEEIVAMGRAEHVPYRDPDELAAALKQKIEAIYELEVTTIDDFLATGFPPRSVDKMWRYLNDFIARHPDFPLKPTEIVGQLRGDLAEVEEWVYINAPEVANYETFRMLARIQQARSGR